MDRFLHMYEFGIPACWEINHVTSEFREKRTEKMKLTCVPSPVFLSFLAPDHNIRFSCLNLLVSCFLYRISHRCSFSKWINNVDIVTLNHVIVTLLQLYSNDIVIREIIIVIKYNSSIKNMKREKKIQKNKIEFFNLLSGGRTVKIDYYSISKFKNYDKWRMELHLRHYRREYTDQPFLWWNRPRQYRRSRCSVRKCWFFFSTKLADHLT